MNDQNTTDQFVSAVEALFRESPAPIDQDLDVLLQFLVSKDLTNLRDLDKPTDARTRFTKQLHEEWLGPETDLSGEDAAVALLPFVKQEVKDLVARESTKKGASRKKGGYDKQALQKLWGKKRYEDLVEAPGEPGARLREARFVMQAKVANETRKLGIIMAIATAVMAIATIFMALDSILRALN